MSLVKIYWSWFARHVSKIFVTPVTNSDLQISTRATRASREDSIGLGRQGGSAANTMAPCSSNSLVQMCLRRERRWKSCMALHAITVSWLYARVTWRPLRQGGYAVQRRRACCTGTVDCVSAMSKLFEFLTVSWPHTARTTEAKPRGSPLLRRRWHSPNLQLGAQ